MVAQVVLLVSADAACRAHWSALVRRAGHWPLEAATVERAVAYLHRVRPGLVVSEAQVGVERGLALRDDLRTIAPLHAILLVVSGPLTPAEARLHDPALEVWADGLTDAALDRVLDDLLPVGRPVWREPPMPHRGASVLQTRVREEGPTPNQPRPSPCPSASTGACCGQPRQQNGQA